MTSPQKATEQDKPEKLLISNQIILHWREEVKDENLRLNKKDRAR